MQGLLCKAKESNMTMGINWDMVDPAKGSQAGWDIMSSENSEEIAVSDVRLYVNVSNNSGVSWIMDLAEICIHPVEAWWVDVSDANTSATTHCWRYHTLNALIMLQMALGVTRIVLMACELLHGLLMRACVDSCETYGDKHSRSTCAWIPHKYYQQSAATPPHVFMMAFSPTTSNATTITDESFMVSIAAQSCGMIIPNDATNGRETSEPDEDEENEDLIWKAYTGLRSKGSHTRNTYVLHIRAPHTWSTYVNSDPIIDKEKAYKAMVHFNKRIKSALHEQAGSVYCTNIVQDMLWNHRLSRYSADSQPILS
jgi:hypothetical protein